MSPQGALPTAGARLGPGDTVFPFALKALWLYLSIAIGRLTELIPGLANFPLAKLAVAACLAGIVVRGGFRTRVRILSLPVPRVALALLLLAIVSTMFSVWKSNSLQYLVGNVLVVAVGFALTIKLVDNERALRATLFVIVISGLVQACYALATSTGRISAGISYDTNDLAYLLLTVLPISLAFLARATAVRTRASWSACCLLLLIALMLTQSRGGFLGLLVVAAHLAWRPLPSQNKSSRSKTQNRRTFASLILALVACLFVWISLPSATRERLSTVISIGSDYNSDRSIRTGRMDIWIRNSEAAVKRPIGYGIAAFEVVDMLTGGAYKAPHNSVIQVLVELGFLGAALFLWVNLLAWRGLGLPRDDDPDQRLFCRAIQASLAGNFVAGLFLSQAYSSLLWTLLAVAAIAGSLIAVPQQAAPRRLMAAY